MFRKRLQNIKTITSSYENFKLVNTINNVRAIHIDNNYYIFIDTHNNEKKYLKTEYPELQTSSVKETGVSYKLNNAVKILFNGSEDFNVIQIKNNNKWILAKNINLDKVDFEIENNMLVE